MQLVADFLVNTAAGLVGVFAGVVLALWTERVREARQKRKEEGALEQDLVHSRRLVLSSVVKNTSEAKSLGTTLETSEDPYLFEISFELAQAAPVTLTLYDCDGRAVCALAAGNHGSGRHRIEWDARGVAAGVYFLRLEAGRSAVSRKAVILGR